MRRLFGRRERPAPPPPPPPRPPAEVVVAADWILSQAWLGWEAPLNAVRGESFYPETLKALAGPVIDGGYTIPVVATLVREPANQYDANAIRVDVDGKPVGHIARELAERLAPKLDAAGWARCRSRR